MFTLVIGGAASGKSAWAEEHVLRLGGRRMYIAAMRPSGEEAQARVERHRRLRAGKGFETLECYTDLASAQVPPGGNVLLEDLGNLLANEMFDVRGGETAVLHGVEALLRRCANVTVVSNEIFSGGSAYGEDTLRYMYSLAWLNRALAARAELVVEVVCGLPNVLKGELK